MLFRTNIPFIVRLCKILPAIVLISCGSSLPVRVLKEGATRVSASVGGPIAPSTIPIVLTPYITAGAMYGVTDQLTVHANLHALMTAFGVLGLDAGASLRAIAGKGAVPEITVAARMMMFTDFYSFSNVRLYPDLSANASWLIGEKTLVYGGSHLTFQWQPYTAFVSPFAGILFPVSDKVSLQTELMWQAANVNTESGVFDGKTSIGSTGSFGGFIGVVIEL